MSTHVFEAPTVGLGRLISEGSKFLVPHHQRDYSWTGDEIEQLFTDISEARKQNFDYYFLGLMVFIPTNDGDYTILDGQQRMATTVIILSAIRNWLRNYAFNTDADQIQNTYIARRELGEDELYPRIVLNETNNHYFHTYVIKERPTTDIELAKQKLKKQDPNRILLEAILYCRSKIAELATSNGDTTGGERKLFELVRYLRDSVRIVRLTVPNEADAYTVFETLNDRGLDLTVLDLVKNYIFGKAGSQNRLGEFKSRWMRMTAVLSNVRGDDYLKAYWTSRYGRTQKAQLFPNIKQQYKTPDEVALFSIDLLEGSSHYAAIDVADDPIWSTYSSTARERVRILRMLRAQSIHPVILSGLAKLAPREMERLLWLLEVLIVRYQLIGGNRTGLLEIGSARLAADIFQGKVTTATAAYQAIRDIFPSDSEFRDAFEVKQERNNAKAQYILNRLEVETRRREVNSAVGDELEPKSLTVEHIYPQSSGPEWATLDAMDPLFSEELTYRLGNLTLLGGVNKDLGQRGFDYKRDVFAKSALLITQKLKDYENWNRTAVETRQEEMARIAVSIWRFQ